MKPIDISPLIKGGLVVIGIALATGQYGCFQKWSIRQVARALYVDPKPNSQALFSLRPHPRKK
jgi:hypothetical protein